MVSTFDDLGAWFERCLEASSPKLERVTITQYDASGRLVSSYELHGVTTVLETTPAPRPAKVGDRIRIRGPLTPHAEWPVTRLAVWSATVTAIFDDGAYVLDSYEAGEPAGAYMIHDLRGYVHEDGAPIEEHPGASCDSLGGCIRNPIGVCVRCEVAS